MAIILSDNIQLSKPVPLRTTEVVGVDISGLPPSTYDLKESIPAYMRYLYMEVKDELGKKWVLRNPLDMNQWSPVPFPNVEPAIDGVFSIRKVGDAYTWETAGSGGGLALGESSTTAYRGDRGKIGYDHSQLITGNPHNIAYSDLQGSLPTHGHSISEITNLQTSLDDKVDDSQVLTDVIAGAVFTDTQIDPQEGLGIVIDKTDPLAPIFTASIVVVDTTYAELKVLHDTAALVPGVHYRITDFKTQWEMDTYEYSGSVESVAKYAFDTAVEPLIVKAISHTAVGQEAHSETYPTHIIHYHAYWDWDEPTAAPGNEPRGLISFRKDPDLVLSAGFDYIGYRVTRFAVTADAWDVGTTYGRGKTCSVPDVGGDALYISLIDGNSGADPSLPATDGVEWMTFRPAGADTTGMYRDFVASDFTDDEGYHTPVMADTDTFGFQVDETRFQNFPTYAFSDDLTKVAGEGAGTYQKYFYCHIENTGNLFMSTNNAVSSYENYLCHLDVTIKGFTAVSGYIYQIVLRNMFGGTLKNYIFGASYAIFIPNSEAWFHNNYFEGLSFIEGIGSAGTSATMTKNIYVRKGVARDTDLGRGLNGGHFSGSSNLFYKGGWSHANIKIKIYGCNILGSMEYNREIELHNSTIGPAGGIISSYIGVNGYKDDIVISNKNVTVNGTIAGSRIINIENSVIEGTLQSIEATMWDGVTIPANVTFDEVSFNIPKWYGLNTWTGTPLVLKGVGVYKKYIDNATTPTVEKLWYQTVDATGAVTDVELT